MERMERAGEVTRRGLITGGIAAAIGAIASMVAPGKAGAADGDSLKVGQGNTGSSTTGLSAAIPEDGRALDVRDTQKKGVAVYGEGRQGVWGSSNVSGGGGVWGLFFAQPDALDGVGVWGGVLTPDGEEGGERGVGVWGTAGAGTHPRGLEVVCGAGVQGDGSKVGVVGNSQSGVGVRASSPDGVALDVRGRTHLSRSGRTTIRRGARFAKVTGHQVSPASMIHATIQQHPGANVYITYAARTSATSFAIWLNRKAPTNIKVAWVILD